MKWHHNSYSEEALAEMQKEAENRVRQMQSRARLVGDSSVSPPQNFYPTAPAKKEPPSPKIDSDSLIILALLWLLWNEHADSKLLLALLYILIQ